MALPMPQWPHECQITMIRYAWNIAGCGPKSCEQIAAIQINPVRRIRNPQKARQADINFEYANIIPAHHLAYRCARDGLVILLRNKNKNEKLA
jgi:hypothetical protein